MPSLACLFPTVRAVFALCALLCCAVAPAQVLETLPDLRLTINGTVLAIVQQADGRMLVGGDFTSVDGVPRGNAARLQADGTLDPLWNPDVSDGSVESIAVDPVSGAVYLGGSFQTVGGVYRSDLVKVSGNDGSVDPAFSAHANGTIAALALDGSGALFVAGIFNQIGGSARAGLAKLATTDGAVDTMWNPGVQGNPFVLLLDSATSSLYVGGQISGVGGTPRANLAKLSMLGSGTLDAAWNPAPDNSVSALVLDGSGSIYVGGQFSTMGGQPRRSLARLSASGTAALDPTWTPSAQGMVQTLDLTADAVFIGGLFQTVNDAPQRYLARLSRSGSGATDAQWQPEADDVVNALVVDASGTLVAGGRFIAIAGQESVGLARLAADASLLTAIDVERPGIVHALEAQPDGGLLFGGDFFRADGLRRNNLARLQPDGTLDPQWNPGADGSIDALATNASGTTYVSGDFQRIGADYRPGLAKLDPDGAVDPAWAPTNNGSAYALELQGPHVYIGGNFSNVNGQPLRGIARLAADSGEVDVEWNPSVESGGSVRAIAVDGDEAVYFGGYFTGVGGVGRNHVAKVSTQGIGAVDTAWNPAPDSEVRALALSRAHVYVGGGFMTFGGLPRAAVARIGRDGSVDAGWDPNVGFGFVTAIAIDAARGVYVGGAFYSVGGLTRLNLARLDRDGGVDALWDPAPNHWINALQMQGERVYAGGQFTTLSGATRIGIASYRDASLADYLEPFFDDGFEP